MISDWSKTAISMLESLLVVVWNRISSRHDHVSFEVVRWRFVFKLELQTRNLNTIMNILTFLTLLLDLLSTLSIVKSANFIQHHMASYGIVKSSCNLHPVQCTVGWFYWSLKWPLTISIEQALAVCNLLQAGKQGNNFQAATLHWQGKRNLVNAVLLDLN